MERDSNYGKRCNHMEVPVKVKSRTAILSGNPTSGYISKGNEERIGKNIFTPVFLEALFTVAKIWEQPRCPLTGGVYIMEYFSAMRKKEILPFATTRMGLEGILQSGMS